MDNKTFSIGILSLTAVVLVVANLFTGRLAPRSAEALEVVNDRDYRLVTADAPGGSEALYVIENLSGIVAVLMYDQSKKSLEVVDIQSLDKAFLR